MENAERIEVLYNEPFGIFHSKLFDKKIKIENDFPEGNVADIILAHDAEYILSTK